MRHDRKFILAATRADYQRAAHACPDLGLTDQYALAIIVGDRKNAVRAIGAANDYQMHDAYRRAARMAKDAAKKAADRLIHAVRLHQLALALPVDPTAAQLSACAPVDSPEIAYLDRAAREIADHHNRARVFAGTPGRVAHETHTQLGNYGGYPCYRYEGHIGCVRVSPDRYLVQLDIGDPWVAMRSRVSALTGNRYTRIYNRWECDRVPKIAGALSYAQLARITRRLGVDLYADLDGVYIRNDITDYHICDATRWPPGMLRALRSLGKWRAQLAAKTAKILADLAVKKQRDQLLRRALVANIFVTVADSLAAKNCKTGTDGAKKDCERFLRAGELGGVRADVLIAVRGDQAHSAIIAAALRLHMAASL